MGASVLSITTLSLHRFVAVRSPLVTLAQPRQLRYPRALLCAIWCVSIVVMAPLAAIRRAEHVVVVPRAEPLLFCMEQWSSLVGRLVYSTFLLCFIYVFPASAVLVLYMVIGRRLTHTSDKLHAVAYHASSRSTASSTLAGVAVGSCTSGSAHHRFRCNNVNALQAGGTGSRTAAGIGGSESMMVERRRAAVQCVAFAAFFIVCWLPYHVISAVLDALSAGDAGQVQQAQRLMPALNIALLLAHTNSAINPVVYCFIGKRFRRHVISSFHLHLLPATR